MSFNITCTGCGASSGPSVGICPFCKTMQTSGRSRIKNHNISIINLYDEGKIEESLYFANQYYLKNEDAKKDLAFLILFAKILIETEGPSSKILSVLSEAQLIDPENLEIKDYIELIFAKKQLKPGINDSGELALKKIIKRSPKNALAHFLLGTHLFFQENQVAMALSHLETCVRINPKMLRAWGCLGAAYKKMGHIQLAQRAFQKCIELETDSEMKIFFQEQYKNAHLKTENFYTVNTSASNIRYSSGQLAEDMFMMRPSPLISFISTALWFFRR